MHIQSLVEYKRRDFLVGITVFEVTVVIVLVITNVTAKILRLTTTSLLALYYNLRVHFYNSS